MNITAALLIVNLGVISVVLAKVVRLENKIINLDKAVEEVASIVPETKKTLKDEIHREVSRLSFTPIRVYSK